LGLLSQWNEKRDSVIGPEGDFLNLPDRNFPANVRQPGRAFPWSDDAVEGWNSIMVDSTEDLLHCVELPGRRLKHLELEKGPFHQLLGLEVANRSQLVVGVQVSECRSAREPAG
jgi:hypothetical protein